MEKQGQRWIHEDRNRSERETEGGRGLKVPYCWLCDGGQQHARSRCPQERGKQGQGVSLEPPEGTGPADTGV